MKKIRRNKVINNGGIGFLLAHFFNKAGKFLDIEANRCVVGINTETINKKKIFAVASGKHKAKAIYAALRGGLLHTLVSDEETLKLVLEYGKRANETRRVAN